MLEKDNPAGPFFVAKLDHEGNHHTTSVSEGERVLLVGTREVKGFLGDNRLIYPANCGELWLNHSLLVLNLIV